MTTLRRVKVLLQGFPGGPGVATYCFLDLNTALTSLRNMWIGYAQHMPSDVNISFQGFGDMFDDVTGSITGEWSAAAPAAAQGTITGGYPGPAGAVVTWLTSSILDGRRLRGRTFVVPLGAGSYQEDGSLIPGVVADLTAVSNAFRIEQSASFVVWHRPRAARAATAKLKALPAHAGANALVTDAVVHDRVAILRSRRG
jgi:hypothetical protein